LGINGCLNFLLPYHSRYGLDKADVTGTLPGAIGNAVFQDDNAWFMAFNYLSDFSYAILLLVPSAIYGSPVNKLQRIVFHNGESKSFDGWSDTEKSECG